MSNLSLGLQAQCFVHGVKENERMAIQDHFRREWTRPRLVAWEQSPSVKNEQSPGRRETLYNIGLETQIAKTERVYEAFRYLFIPVQERLLTYEREWKGDLAGRSLTGFRDLWQVLDRHQSPMKVLDPKQLKALEKFHEEKKILDGEKERLELFWAACKKIGMEIPSDLTNLQAQIDNDRSSTIFRNPASLCKIIEERELLEKARAFFGERKHVLIDVLWDDIAKAAAVGITAENAQKIWDQCEELGKLLIAFGQYQELLKAIAPSIDSTEGFKIPTAEQFGAVRSACAEFLVTDVPQFPRKNLPPRPKVTKIVDPSMKTPDVVVEQSPLQPPHGCCVIQ